jgi:hypothetical protein
LFVDASFVASHNMKAYFEIARENQINFHHITFIYLSLSASRISKLGEVIHRGRVTVPLQSFFNEKMTYN